MFDEEAKEKLVSGLGGDPKQAVKPKYGWKQALIEGLGGVSAAIGDSFGHGGNMDYWERQNQASDQRAADEEAMAQQLAADDAARQEEMAMMDAKSPQSLQAVDQLRKLGLKVPEGLTAATAKKVMPQLFADRREASKAADRAEKASRKVASDERKPLEMRSKT